MPRPPRAGCTACNRRWIYPRMCPDCLGRAHEQERDWYTRTGHCGYCGDPGVFCTCTDTDPCGCRDLHEMGSGRVADALDAFAVVPVGDTQGDLFGGDTP